MIPYYENTYVVQTKKGYVSLDAFQLWNKTVPNPKISVLARHINAQRENHLFHRREAVREGTAALSGNPCDDGGTRNWPESAFEGLAPSAPSVPRCSLCGCQVGSISSRVTSKSVVESWHVAGEATGWLVGWEVEACW